MTYPLLRVFHQKTQLLFIIYFLFFCISFALHIDVLQYWEHKF